MKTEIGFTPALLKKVLCGTKTEARGIGRLEEINESPGDWLWMGGTQGFMESNRFDFVGDPSEEVITLTCPYGDAGSILDVTGSDVRLRVLQSYPDRLHEMTPADLTREGMNPLSDWQLGDESAYAALVSEWKVLWNSIYGDRLPWESNPWVWVVKFEVVK